MSRAAPAVSIGLPVRNGLPFLPAALDSILGQTFGDFELIISDNASQDGTRAICEEFAARDSRIRCFTSDLNRGAAWNYNRVFAEARGRYFKWAASDDICCPTFLERCVALLEADPQVVLCYPRALIIDEFGKSLHRVSRRLRLEDLSCVRRFRRVVRDVPRGGAPAVFGVIRSHVLRQTGLMGVYPASDVVLLGELALRGPFREVPETLLLKRDHPGNSMRTYRTMRERASWFHPQLAAGRKWPLCRLLVEYARAVHRAPLSPFHRWGCYAQLVFWLHFVAHRAVGHLYRTARRFGAQVNYESKTRLATDQQPV